MDVGKADTLKHGHRPEKLFMDMYMLQPNKEVKQKRSQAIIHAESNPPVSRHVSQSTVPPCFIRKLTDDWLNSVQAQIKKSSYVKYNNIIHSHILPEFDNVPLNELTHRGYRSSVRIFLIMVEFPEKGFRLRLWWIFFH